MNLLMGSGTSPTSAAEKRNAVTKGLVALRNGARNLIHSARVRNSDQRVLPTCIIAGTQKGGTTFLFDVLSKNPAVLASTVKEVHYFDLHWDKGQPWYRGHFATQQEVEKVRQERRAAAVLEASPYYMFHPAVMSRIAETVPECKIVLVLREPAARAQSHYYHNVFKGHESLEWDAALAAEEERLAGEAEKLLADPTYRSRNHQHFSYRARGLYAEQLEEVYRHFPKEQVLVLNSQVLFKQTQEAVQRVLGFMGLPDWQHIPLPKPAGRKYPGQLPDLTELKNFYRPHNERLFELIGEDWGWNG